MSFPLSPEAAAYIEALRAEFADLPAEERDDLLADVEASLVEAADEGEGTIAARLGSPASFAAELRAAAGIQPGLPSTPSGPGIVDRAVAAARRLRANPRFASALDTLDQLAPIWWLARAYVAAGLLALIAGVSWAISHPEVPRFTNAPVTVVMLLALAAASLWLGVRARRRPPSSRGRAALFGLNVVLAIAALPVAVHVLGTRAPVDEILVSVPEAPQPGLVYNGTSVQNLYPYSRSGRLLQDVLLYDDLGRPVNVGGPSFPDPDRRVLTTTRGDRIFNSFPIRYYDPQTTTVAHPYAGPAVQLPQVLTPPLVVSSTAN